MEIIQTGIQVLTHNGKMPRDGGKRIGYISGSLLFRLDGAIINLAAIQAQQAVAERAAQKLAEEKKRAEQAAKAAKFKPAGQLIFYNLPMSFGGRCTNCYSANCYDCYCSTDQGIKNLMVCRMCMQKMRTSRS